MASTTIHRFEPGERIRLVTAVATDVDGNTATVSLRYPWPFAEPEHVCVVNECHECLTALVRLAGRRLKAEVADVVPVRDRQAEAR